MRAYNAALGQECVFCHVMGNFPSDDNPKKGVALMMISMTQEVNAKFPDGKMHVTCFTCHNGSNMPKTDAPAAAPVEAGSARTARRGGQTPRRW